MDEREAFIALNMIDHIGPVRARHLLNHFGSAARILQASREELLRVEGIGEETAESIVRWEEQVDLSRELQRIREFGCRVLIPQDEEYPELLRQVYDPPLVLYVKGRLLPRDRNAVAIVGSRMTTHYGQEAARKLAYQLAYVGVTVVSGGARGIDTAAHQGALNAKGRTVAVLGTGINLVTPPENAELFERIAAQGALITQFPFNRPADRQSFPIRNRIVAGMTLGTVVVEAGLHSGALITANFAVDYGRQVFAVPGRIDSPQSKGCHDLIKKGAKLCESAEDILTEFEYLFPPSNRAGSGAPPGPGPALELPETEQRVLDALGPEERSVDEIIRLTGLPAATVSVALLALEMKRLVRQLPGKVFVRAR
ncbi:DNA-protecting protein DprA [Limisphaera ngatamarikiensis]|uniref:DNA-protecting protein DprA n=1 Tax=Limisphaera ngatamarikiensis TaxID=1324935 RepID=A0A6M1RLT3_9BACT|nr:DNA-processing protein DprA [Limisphaera ngatamarikiensis]NGO38593.1 DNA-protecting protein DprA [Limisphaera ngatamarikiensis]